MSGRVDSVWVSSEAAAPMESIAIVRAVPGGLEGDRYLTGEGYYAPVDVCEVTFIASEDFAAIRETAGIDLTDGTDETSCSVVSISTTCWKPGSASERPCSRGHVADRRVNTSKTWLVRRA